MATGGCKSADVVHSKGGYEEPIAIIALILDHKNGHYVKLNRVAFKYPNFKKDVDPDAHVKMFNSIVKENVETSKEYIINAFSYTLKDTTSN